MGALGRIGAFVFGGLLGAGVGAAVAMVVAPQSGDELRDEVERRVDRARIAGLKAQTRTEEELIRRFRSETDDETALRDWEAVARVKTAQQMVELERSSDREAVPDASSS